MVKASAGRLQLVDYYNTPSLLVMLNMLRAFPYTLLSDGNKRHIQYPLGRIKNIPLTISSAIKFG